MRSESSESDHITETEVMEFPVPLQAIAYKLVLVATALVLSQLTTHPQHTKL
jgi:hypothetical protein